jgi:hypothetical protein
MKKYRITKYNPKLRNELGHYSDNDWTDISDVGNVFNGKSLSETEYIEVETDYITSVIKILQENNQDYLRLVSYNKDLFEFFINSQKKDWAYLPNLKSSSLYEDKKIYLEDIAVLIKINLRAFIGMTLEIKDEFYVHFGWDLYMYIGCPNISTKLRDQLNSTSIYIEDSDSPYYSSKHEYVVEKVNRKSNIIEDEFVIDKMFSEQIIKTYKLSAEHPGTLLDKPLAIQKVREFKVLTKGNKRTYKYYLSTKSTE